MSKRIPRHILKEVFGSTRYARNFEDVEKTVVNSVNGYAHFRSSSIQTVGAPLVYVDITFNGAVYENGVVRDLSASPFTKMYFKTPGIYNLYAIIHLWNNAAGAATKDFYFQFKKNGSAFIASSATFRTSITALSAYGQLIGCVSNEFSLDDYLSLSWQCSDANGQVFAFASSYSINLFCRYIGPS